MRHNGMVIVFALLALVLLWPAWPAVAADESDAPKRPNIQGPNILWLTCEDISPNLGCYGDPYAVTPNLDRLARQGVRYTRAFAPIGVCAPARSCLITGMYPPSIGTHPMRCEGMLPKQVKCFPQYLREAGYHCTNNVKTDYNFKHDPATWNESSNKAHWRKRRPGQPFFSVFNFTSCHESQIRLPEAEYQKRIASFHGTEKHDPAKAPLPPYHPDTPEVRRDWARYADMITFMDKEAGRVLAELEADGLADDTIVFFFSDHGAGMPRSKRWLYDSSTRVPFILRFPKKWRHLAPAHRGETTDRLVSFVDFAPTMLSLAGIKPPAHMQGKAFLGPHAGKPREYVYGFRDRMDERYDMVRSVRDKRYKYIRNYMPHLPWFHHQHLSYAYEMPTLRVWQRLSKEGKLQGAAAIFMAQEKPMEELYDTESDPHEIRNLASSTEHQAVLDRLRTAHRQWIEESIDLGFLPEADLRTRFGDKPAYDAVRNHPKLYPIREIAGMAEFAGMRSSVGHVVFLKRLKDADPAVRYWATMGLAMRAAPADSNHSEKPGEYQLNEMEIANIVLRLKQTALHDDSRAVRVAAADALCWLDRHKAALPVLAEELQDPNEWVRLQAINVLDRIDEKAQPVLAQIERALKDKNPYVVRVAQHAVQELRTKK